MKWLFVIMLVVANSFTLLSQSPVSSALTVEAKKAYQNGTRSLSGVPGLNYWQNNARYQINVELNVADNLLVGEEKVTYFNNSPDTLKRLVIRLYPNIYKEGNPRQWPIGDGVNEGMVIKSLSINDDSIDWNNRKIAYMFSTNLSIFLPEPLAPGDSLEMKASWHYEVSDITIRTGKYGKDTWFIAYWYPQIAVYDDINGWDMIEYLGAVEFYNDFNEYDVHISTPPGYVVWATGELVNEHDMFSDYVLKNLMTARVSSKITRIFSAEDFKKSRKIIRHDGINAFHTNTWHFAAAHVPDFTFAVRRNVNWDGSSLVVDKGTNRRVFVDAVYADSARTYQNAAKWARASVAYMSTELPGFAFPYDHMTTVSNDRMGGGMESPMMANNGDPSDSTDAALTIFHEISHTYFPFFMGTNERKYAWMDEGWAAFLTMMFGQQDFPGDPDRKRFVERFEGVNGSEKEATLMTLSYNLGDYDSYRVHAYVRSALAYYFLRNTLGDSTFKVALHTYMERWQGKHPIPYDFFNSFNDATGADLSWFFIPWFFDRSYADLGIKKITNNNIVVVQNYGGLPLPVVVTCEFADGTTEIVNKRTSVWGSGERAVALQVDKNKMIKKVVLGSELIPDIDNTNNVMEVGSN